MKAQLTRSIILGVALAAAQWFGLSSAIAAKFVQPPIQDLFKASNQVTVLELESIDHKNQQAHFEKVRDLWGKVEGDTLTLKIPAPWLQRLESGERYIIGHSKFRKHPILRDVLELHPDGPSVLSAFVVQHAIFDDSSELRYLNKAHQDAKPNASKILSRTLNLLEEATGNTRLLAAFQFQMSDKLFAKGMRGKHLDQLKDIVLSNRLSAEEEEFIMRSVHKFPERYREEWISAHCREHIEQHQQPYDLASFIPALIKTCTSVLADANNSADLSRLAKLLHVNAPGVAKSAFKAIQKISPEQALSFASAAVNSEEPLHMETKRVLDTYLRQQAKN